MSSKKTLPSPARATPTVGKFRLDVASLRGNSGTQSAKKAGNEIQIQMIRTLAGVDVVWLEKYKGQDGFGKYLKDAIDIQDHEVRKRGFILTCSRRIGKSSQEVERNKSVAKNGIRYPREVFLTIPVSNDNIEEKRKRLLWLQQWLTKQEHNAARGRTGNEVWNFYVLKDDYDKTGPYMCALDYYVKDESIIEYVKIALIWKGDWTKWAMLNPYVAAGYASEPYSPLVKYNLGYCEIDYKLWDDPEFFAPEDVESAEKAASDDPPLASSDGNVESGALASSKQLFRHDRLYLPTENEAKPPDTVVKPRLKESYMVSFNKPENPIAEAQNSQQSQTNDSDTDCKPRTLFTQNEK